MTASEQRTELVAAIRASDWAKVTELGWSPVLQILKAGWPKKLSASDADAYAVILGAHNPETVHDAIVAIASSGRAEWRPGPAQIAAEIAASNPSANVPVEQAPREDVHPITLARVAELVARGEAVCDCRPRGANVISAGGVLRCTDCNGLERGQAYASEEQAA